MTPGHSAWLRDAIAELERTLADPALGGLQRLHAEKLLRELQQDERNLRTTYACHCDHCGQ